MSHSLTGLRPKSFASLFERAGRFETKPLCSQDEGPAALDPLSPLPDRPGLRLSDTCVLRAWTQADRAAYAQFHKTQSALQTLPEYEPPLSFETVISPSPIRRVSALFDGSFPIGEFRLLFGIETQNPLVSEVTFRMIRGDFPLLKRALAVFLNDLGPRPFLMQLNIDSPCLIAMGEELGFVAGQRYWFRPQVRRLLRV